MKKFCILIATMFTVANGFSQALITYGKYKVGKEEFLRAYNKNKTPVTDKEKSIRDYVNLYTNFKMKVKAAQELRLDTSAQIKSDLDNFRHQIEENYMSDEKAFKKLMDEAFERSQQDVHVIRYSVAMDENTDPDDTLKKTTAIYSVYNQLISKNNTVDLASTPEVKRVDMGFVSVFSLPYQYENIVYGLKTGEASKPYRTKKAIHVFQVIDQRRSAGKWKVAQILFTYPENADEGMKMKAKKLADSVYSLLQNNSDFSSLARTYSDDKLTYLNGGEMPEFGTGKYDISFEKEVVKLKKDNDITAPFTTSFGIHIVKRLSYTPTPTSKDDDALQFELKQKLMQDERVRIAKDIFAKEIITKIGFKQAIGIKQADLFRYVDTVMAYPESTDITTITPISKKTIVNFSKGGIKGEDWLNFARDYKSNAEMYKEESNEELWEKYKTTTALDFYRKHLEDFNKEFAFQLQEFKEGNMLFEVMEKQVWSKAAADSIGLLKYYNANKQQYMWSPSADALIINSVSEAIAKEALDSLKGGSPWKDLVEMKKGELQGDSGRFELTQINGDAKASPGSYSAIIKNPDGTATFTKYFKFYADGDQRSFEDSRGMIINDYQAVVEKKWLDELRKKYPVNVNEALLKTIIKE